VVVLGQYGVSQSVALSFGIILNMVTVVPLLVLGSLALWVWAAPLFDRIDQPFSKWVVD
jgi:hypothetical protein